MMKQRLDKLLSLSGERSRSQSAVLIRSGAVMVNGQTVRDPSAKAEEGDQILLRGESVQSKRFMYGMLHKPSGVVTASEDRRTETVMDLLPEAWKRRDVMPVGRLDKDTTGLLLFTNDGTLAHYLLSPKKEIWKKYVAVVSGKLDEDDVRRFSEGIPLRDFTAQPAKLVILSADEEQSEAEVSVHEGKFHQVKRMFLSCGHEVLRLHRAAFGPLTLPRDLAVGEYRILTDTEVELLRAAVGAGEASNDE